MGRDITTSLSAESKQEIVRPFLLVKLSFDNGISRVNSTDKNLTLDVDGDGLQSFLGIGRMGSISPIVESSDLQPSGYTMELTGVPIDHVSDALNEDYQGRSVKLWLGFFNDSYQVIADPTLVDASERDLKRAHIPFIRLEAIRISLAKHEVWRKRSGVASSALNWNRQAVGIVRASPGLTGTASMAPDS